MKQQYGSAAVALILATNRPFACRRTRAFQRGDLGLQSDRLKIVDPVTIDYFLRGAGKRRLCCAMLVSGMIYLASYER